MKIIINRKSQVTEAWYFTMAAFFLAFILLLIMILVSRYQSQRIEIDQDLVRDIYMQRAFNNPNCFAYFDEDIQRTYPGLIDFYKFTDEQIEECYKVCNATPPILEKDKLGSEGKKFKRECMQKFGFKFILKDPKKEKDNIIATAQTKNFKSFSTSFVRPVLIRDDKGIRKAIMEIQVQRTLAAIQFEVEQRLEED